MVSGYSHVETHINQPTKTACVRIRDVCKTYGSGNDSVHAVRGISFDLYTSELAMIVGPSGCGKTTLLSILAGTTKYDKGDVDVFSSTYSTMTESEITHFRAVNIGFIFQQFHLIPTLTCKENVSIPLLILNENRHKAIAAAEEVLTTFGLQQQVNRFPVELSGGQQQRVAIARALVHNPRLIICDEPTSALDLETGMKVVQILKSIAKDPSKCVVIVTHDHRIFKYADKIIEMDDGKIVREQSDVYRDREE